MKVTGFSFIKDAIKYDYPIVEAIRSVLPVCDEFVVAVGASSDETLRLIQSIDPGKIRIVETIWDEQLREGGRVLAVETDKAFQAISKDTDWAFYIQGDEVVHESFLPIIRKAMHDYAEDKNVDGFLFHYLHFYGSYDYVAAASNFYKHEIRVIRNQPDIYSYRDAQGFRKGNNLKLNVIPLDAYIYHYGWVKQPKAMQAKQENFNKYWHDDAWVAQHVAKADEYDYSNIKCLERFSGSHPAVMQARIARMNWTFDIDPSFNRPSLKDQVKRLALKYFGIDLNYRNYNIIKNKRLG
jgi:hypothetical protein